MKINLEVKTLKTILNKIKLTGKNCEGVAVDLIEGCVLRLEDNKIKCEVFDTSFVVFASFEFKNIEILENGNIPIGNINLFLSYLNRFKDEDKIILENEDNLIKIQKDGRKKTAYIPMVDETFIEDNERSKNIREKLKISEEEVAFGTSIMKTKIIADSEYINEFIDDGNVDDLSRIYPIIVKDGKVVCQVGVKKLGMIYSELQTKESTGNCEVHFMNGIDNVFKNLEGEVTIYLADNSPMIVMKEDDKFKFEFVIASSSRNE